MLTLTPCSQIYLQARHLCGCRQCVSSRWYRTESTAMVKHRTRRRWLGERTTRHNLPTITAFWEFYKSKLFAFTWRKLCLPAIAGTFWALRRARAMISAPARVFPIFQNASVDWLPGESFIFRALSLTINEIIFSVLWHCPHGHVDIG